MTKIEWTEKTWNPVIGCSRVSEGCRNCYAERMAVRLASNPATPEYADVAKSTPAGPRWTGKVKVVASRLDELTWKKPRMVFVNSMSDLFHEDLPFVEIELIFHKMWQASRHTFQVLTKRPERAVEFVRWCKENAFRLGDAWPLPNVWIGTSVENQEQANKRIPELVKIPAAVRFLSLEPLLGPVELDLMGANYGMYGVDWVIVGGESGPNARPMHPDWAWSVRDQCQEAGVPFFFKQWGEWLPNNQVWPANYEFKSGQLVKLWEPGKTGAHSRKIGKQAAGRLLDGREWNEFPGGAK